MNRSALSCARVLVVDDCPDTRRLVAACLKNTQVIVEEAADGLSALRLAREKRPDLVILDLDLPHLDGLGVTRALRADGLDAKTMRVIALSARADAEIEDLCAKAGMNDYLAKPLRDLSVLLRKVRRQLALRPRSPQTEQA